MRCAGLLALLGETRNAYVLVRKPEGKNLLGRLWRKWEDNTKPDLNQGKVKVKLSLCLTN
jgi:hypothetical protein